jgi:hypothetical protein
VRRRAGLLCFLRVSLRAIKCLTLAPLPQRMNANTDFFYGCVTKDFFQAIFLCDLKKYFSNLQHNSEEFVSFCYLSKHIFKNSGRRDTENNEILTYDGKKIQNINFMA